MSGGTDEQRSIDRFEQQLQNEPTCHRPGYSVKRRTRCLKRWTLTQYGLAPYYITPAKFCSARFNRSGYIRGVVGSIQFRPSRSHSISSCSELETNLAAVGDPFPFLLTAHSDPCLLLGQSTWNVVKTLTLFQRLLQRPNDVVVVYHPRVYAMSLGVVTEPFFAARPIPAAAGEGDPLPCQITSLSLHMRRPACRPKRVY